ncbi:MAG: hypothetical protein AAF646_02395 [Pseudomonadota bacterium]
MIYLRYTALAQRVAAPRWRFGGSTFRFGQTGGSLNPNGQFGAANADKIAMVVLHFRNTAGTAPGFFDFNPRLAGTPMNVAIQHPPVGKFTSFGFLAAWLPFTGASAQVSVELANYDDLRMYFLYLDDAPNFTIVEADSDDDTNGDVSFSVVSGDQLFFTGQGFSQQLTVIEGSDNVLTNLVDEFVSPSTLRGRHLIRVTRGPVDAGTYAVTGTGRAGGFVFRT